MGQKKADFHVMTGKELPKLSNKTSIKDKKMRGVPIPSRSGREGLGRQRGKPPPCKRKVVMGEQRSSTGRCWTFCTTLELLYHGLSLPLCLTRLLQLELLCAPLQSSQNILCGHIRRSVGTRHLHPEFPAGGLFGLVVGAGPK